METAWQTRRYTLMSPPAEASEMKAVLHEVHAQLDGAAGMCRGFDAPGLLVQILVRRAHVEKDAGWADQARASLEDALTTARSANNPGLVRTPLRHIGNLHREAGRNEKARLCYTEAMALYKADDHNTDPLGLANLLRPIALLHEAEGANDEAIGCWQEAQAIYRALEVRVGVDECAEHLNALGA